MSNKKTSFMVMGILGFIGVCFVAVAAMALWSRYKISDGWVPVQAVISEVDHEEEDAIVVYEFMGESYHRRLNYYSSGMDAGDQVTVYVDPETKLMVADEVTTIIVAVFGIIGVALILTTVIIGYTTAKKERKYQELMANGITVYPEITSIEENQHIYVNGVCPWVITAELVDDFTGERHEFESVNIWKDPNALYRVGNTIRVKVESGNYDNYVFDLTGLQE